MAKIEVEVWSDVACPWCWVGKRHLETALAGVPHEVAVTWRAFELDPGAPTAVEDVDYAERLAKKYRTSRDEAQAMIDRMTATGAAAGLELRFDRVRPTNTFDAHRLLHWAGGQGRGSELKEELFVAYLRDGRLMSDHDVLVEVAEKAGLDPQTARAVLSGDAGAKKVRAEEALAARQGIRSVPTFVVDRRYAIQGAQLPERLRAALDEAVSA